VPEEEERRRGRRCGGARHRPMEPDRTAESIGGGGRVFDGLFFSFSVSLSTEEQLKRGFNVHQIYIEKVSKKIIEKILSAFPRQVNRSYV
jgi:hypothetical protein